MQTLIVRAATTTDIPALVPLWYEKTILQQQADRRIVIAPQGREQWTAAAHEWLADPHTMLFIATDADTLAGYLVVGVRPNAPGLLPSHIGVIADIALDAHHYHAGVGRNLVEAACGWLRAHEIQHISIDVVRRHAVEQAFWRALGAREWTDRLWMKL